MEKIPDHLAIKDGDKPPPSFFYKMFGLHELADIRVASIVVQKEAAIELSRTTWFDGVNFQHPSWRRIFADLGRSKKPRAVDTLVCLMFYKIKKNDLSSMSPVLKYHYSQAGYTINQCLKDDEPIETPVAKPVAKPAAKTVDKMPQTLDETVDTLAGDQVKKPIGKRFVPAEAYEEELGPRKRARLDDWNNSDFIKRLTQLEADIDKMKSEQAISDKKYNDLKRDFQERESIIKRDFQERESIIMKTWWDIITINSNGHKEIDNRVETLFREMAGKLGYAETSGTGDKGAGDGRRASSV